MTQLYKSLNVLSLQSAEQCCYRPSRTCCDFAPVAMSHPPALVLSPEREGRAAVPVCHGSCGVTVYASSVDGRKNFLFVI